MTKIIRLNKINGDWFQFYGYTYAKKSRYRPNFGIQLAPFVKIKIGNNEPVLIRGEINTKRDFFILTRSIGVKSEAGNALKLLRTFFTN